MDKMLGSLFGKKDKMPKNGGNVLGGEMPKAPLPPPPVLDITFAQASLGMTLSASPSGLAMVAKVEANSEASRAGVKPGFEVVGLEGQPAGAYADLVAVLPSIGRPCRISFRALAIGGSGSSSSSSSSSSVAAPAAKAKGKAAAVPVDPAEAAARREAQLRAAEAREGAFEKKMGGQRVAKAQAAKRNADLQRSISAVEEGGRTPQTAEGAAAAAAACAREAAEAEVLGFNPYKPIFGSASQGRAAVSAVSRGEVAPITGGASSSSGSSSGGGSPASPPVSPRSPSAAPAVVAVQSEAAGSGGDSSEALNEALALLASLDSLAARDAVSTVAKIMANLTTNFEDEKFHRVRLANKAFNKKVRL